MNTLKTNPKEPYETPDITDIKPVSFVKGQQPGSGVDEGDSEWDD